MSLVRLQLHDMFQIVPFQHAENGDFVKAVEEFRTELFARFLQDFFPHGGVVRLVGGHGPEAHVLCLLAEAAPTLEVRMMMVLRKLILRPRESVTLPSSRIWRSRFMTSGWAFSTSSNRMTE